jgi:hypothetical protein
MAWLQKRDRSDPTPAAGHADPRLAVRESVIRWAAGSFAGTNKDTVRQLMDAVAKLQSEYCELSIQLSGDLSKTRRPIFGLSWLDQFHAFELSEAQARQLGIESDSFSLRGTGGKPRRDTRQSPPAVRLNQLRISDGEPVSADAPITVAVTCEPGSKLPQDARLRVGYSVGGLCVVASAVIDDFPPDGVLRQRLEPLAEDDWVQGPVPIFVDLVVAQHNNDGLRFTAVSNTLTALVDVGRASGAPQRDDVATAAARWLGSVFVDGPDARMITSLRESIDGILRGGNHFEMLVPAEFTTTSTAYYGFSCAGGFFPLAMTRAQAVAAGVKSDGVILRGTFNVDAGVRPHLAQLHDLQLRASGATNAEIFGTVVAAFHQPPPPNLMLRMSRIFDEASAVAVKPVAELPSNGVFSFTLYPPSGDKPRGPSPLAVDMCVNEGSETSPQLTSVSNTLVTLVDVTAPPPPTPQREERDPFSQREDARKPLARDMFANADNARPGTVSAPGPGADTAFRGTPASGYRESFLTDTELPGMELAEDNRLLRTFNEDAEAFPAAGGVVCGLARWAPAYDSSRGQRTPPGAIPSDRLIDLRWMFADAASAQRWHRNRFAENAEGMPALGSHSVGGVEYHVFGGRQRDPLFGGGFVSFNILFVIGAVVAKVFLADTDDLGLTEELAREVAHRAGRRISQALSPPQQHERPAKVSLSSLKASDLFSFFNMEEASRQAALDHRGTWVIVEPGGYNEFIRLWFTIDDHEDVIGFTLGLDRRWLDGPGSGTANAGDLAKSVIASVAAGDPVLQEVSDQLYSAVMQQHAVIVSSPDVLDPLNAALKENRGGINTANLTDVPDEELDDLITAVRRRGPSVIAAPDAVKGPTSDPHIASFVRAFFDGNAGEATVTGSGVITAKNVVIQGRSPSATWLTIEWSLPGVADR